MKATYDADHHILYIALSGHPGTEGCVKHTEERDGLLYDIGHDDKVIGLEVMLPGPLEVMSGDNGATRTGNLVPVALAFGETAQMPADAEVDSDGY